MVVQAFQPPLRMLVNQLSVGYCTT